MGVVLQRDYFTCGSHDTNDGLLIKCPRQPRQWANRLINRDLGLEHLNGLHPSVVLFVIHVGFFLLWAEKVPVKKFLLKLRWFKFLKCASVFRYFGQIKDTILKEIQHRANSKCPLKDGFVTFFKLWAELGKCHPECLMLLFVLIFLCGPQLKYKFFSVCFNLAN